MVATPAAEITGCPANVEICPNLGFSFNCFMYSNEEIKAPIGIPPPNPFPVIMMSGITL